MNYLARRSTDTAVTEEAVRALIPFLKKGSVEFKSSIVGVLGGFGPVATEAIPSLESAYLDKNLRDVARTALQMVTLKKHIIVNPAMSEPEDEDEGLDLDL